MWPWRVARGATITLFVFFSVLLFPVKGNEGMCLYGWKTLKCFNSTSLPTHLDPTRVLVTRLDMSKRNNTLENLISGVLFQVNLPSLKNLSLSVCRIRKIEKGAFRGGEKIAELDLSYNEITILDPSVFSDLPKLRKLNLKGNPLAAFKEGTNFPELQNLKFLHMESCRLKSLETNIFVHLVNLVVLDLEGNQLTELSWIPPPSSLHHLKMLDLSNNSFSNLNPSIFSNLPKLEVLFMDSNPIKEFDSEFPVLPLRVLWLSDCQLKQIQPHHLKKLRSLQVLSLHKNKQTNIDWISAGSFANLTYLRLSKNREIKHLNLTKLEGLPKLKKLYLSGNNKLKFSSTDEFPSLHNLTRLDLHSSSLKYISPKLLKNLQTLEELRLWGNELTTLNWRTILPLKSLNKLDLYRNPWHCDCHIRSLLNFLERRDINFQSSNVSTKCATTNSPSSVYNSTGKSFADLDRNLLFCPSAVSQIKIIINSAEPNVEATSSDVVLKCYFSGYPIPEMIWTKNGKLLFNATERIQLSATTPDTSSKDEEENAEFSNAFIQNLIIKDSDVSNNGEYECLVANKAGIARKKIVLNKNSRNLWMTLPSTSTLVPATTASLSETSVTMTPFIEAEDVSLPHPNQLYDRDPPTTASTTAIPTTTATTTLQTTTEQYTSPRTYSNPSSRLPVTSTSRTIFSTSTTSSSTASPETDSLIPTTDFPSPRQSSLLDSNQPTTVSTTSVPVPTTTTTTTELLTLPRTYKLSAQIFKFVIDTDTEKDTPISKLQKLGETNRFKNDQSTAKTMQYTNEDTVYDSIEVEKDPSNLQFSSLSVLNEIHSEFTPALALSLKALLSDNGESSSSNQAKSSGWDEEKNIANKIKQILFAAYNKNNNNSDQPNNLYFKAVNEHTFTFRENVTIPSCTVVEWIPFLRRAKNFPFRYTSFAEIFGTYDDDGSQMTADELKEKLDGIELEEVNKDKDTTTVVVKGSGQLTLDLTWYSTKTTQEIPIQGCKARNLVKEGKAKIKFYDKPSYEEPLYKTIVNEGCQLLPKKAINRTESVETEVCVILFTSENCFKSSDSLEVNPGKGLNFPHFADVAQSFQFCDSFKYSTVEEVKQNNNRFYDGLAPPILVSDLFPKPFPNEKVPYTKCKNLRPQDALFSVDRRHCVIFFEREDCLGRSFILRPHSGLRLDHHFDKTRPPVSWKPCAESEYYYESESKSKETPTTTLQLDNQFLLPHLQLFKNQNQTGLFYQAPITSTCTTPKLSSWPPTSLLLVEDCVQLYSLQYCQGFSSKFYPGGDQNFSKEVTSYAACTEEETDVEGESENMPCPLNGYPAAYRPFYPSYYEDESLQIKFYDDPRFSNFLFRTELNGFCQILPDSVRNRVESIETDLCVILFAAENCGEISSDSQEQPGFDLIVHPGNDGSSFPFFANKAQSFQLCETYEADNNTYRERIIQFFEYFPWWETELIAEEILTNKCKNVNERSKKKVSSVVTQHCVILYDGEDCSGNSFTFRPHSAVNLFEHFSRMTTSFTLCPEEFKSKFKSDSEREVLSNFPFLELFKNEDYTRTILRAPIKDSCTTPQEKVWRKTSSVKTEACVVLYSLHYCQGFSVVLLPGSELPPSFAKKVVSFTACQTNDFFDESDSDLSSSSEEEEKSIEEDAADPDSLFPVY